jgi:hypothetical protein
VNDAPKEQVNVALIFCVNFEDISTRCIPYRRNKLYVWLNGFSECALIYRDSVNGYDIIAI